MLPNRISRHRYIGDPDAVKLEPCLLLPGLRRLLAVRATRVLAFDAELDQLPHVFGIEVGGVDVVVWHRLVVTGEREAGGARVVANLVRYAEGEELLQGRYLLLTVKAMGTGAAPIDRPVRDPLAVRAKVGGGVEALGEGYGYVDVAFSCTCAWHGHAVLAIRQLLGLGKSISRAGYVDLGSLRVVCEMVRVPCYKLQASGRGRRLGRIEPVLGGVVKTGEAWYQGMAVDVGLRHPVRRVVLAQVSRVAAVLRAVLATRLLLREFFPRVDGGIGRYSQIAPEVVPVGVCVRGVLRLGCGGVVVVGLDYRIIEVRARREALALELAHATRGLRHGLLLRVGKRTPADEYGQSGDQRGV